MKRIKLRFDKDIPYGSKEHFWHFMLGYLLPSLCFYFQSTNNKRVKMLLVFEDCGPLMNPVIKDISQLLGIPYEISTTAITSERTELLVPRWDISLKNSNLFLLKIFSLDSDMKPGTKRIFKRLVKFALHPRVKVEIGLVKDILFTQKMILKNINQSNNSETNYLLLDRMDIRDFYRPNGQAEIKGYGKSRRGLTDIKETYNSLLAKKIDVSMYCPGSQSIRNQIETFSHCNGFVGIRGAELANMIWLKKRTKVIIINPMGSAYHIYNYASILGLKLIERKSKSKHPNLQHYNINQLLQ